MVSLNLFSSLIDSTSPAHEAIAPLDPAQSATAAEPVIMAAPSTRDRLVEEIVRVNRSATRAFLDRFSDSALRNYLDHLTFAHVPRGGEARWVRPGDTRAICCADAA